MRTLRPGVDRAWRRLKFYAAITKAFSATLSKLEENFYRETPFFKAIRAIRMRRD